MALRTLWLTAAPTQVPQLERIEATMLSIQRERTAIVIRRRYADDADDVALFTGAPIPPVFRLPPTDEAAADSMQTEPLSQVPEEDLPARSVARTTRRTERERRHRERPRPSHEGDDSVAALGYGSDAELSAGDRSDLDEALAAAEADLAALFADVKAPEYRDPNLVIRRRFEEWRDKYGEEYRITFAGLSLAQVWEFWARVEMARWNPFEVRSPFSLA